MTRWRPPHPAKPPPVTTCPHHPRYASQTAAHHHATQAALTGARAAGTPTRCACGGWHLQAQS
jgi:hypothetical protein